MPVGPNLIFLIFTCAAATGAYLIGAHFRTPRFGAVFAAGAVVFFVLLFVFVQALLRSFGGEIS